MFRRIQIALMSAIGGLLIAIAPTSIAYASPPVTNGLTVSLDATNASSISGTTWSGQDGTTPSATLYSSAQYDSVNHYMTMTDVNSTPSYATMGYGTVGDAINPNGDLTIETWVKFNAIHSSNWNIVITKWFNGLNTNSGCTGGNDYHLGLYLGHPDIFTTGTGGQNLTNASISPAAGTWHQLGFTIVNPNNMNGSSASTSGIETLYFDGVAVASISGTTVYHTANASCLLVLGDSRAIAANGLGIEGGLEKVRIYNRALNTAEMNQNFRADASTNGRALAAAPFNSVHPAISGPATFTFNETSSTGTWLNGVNSYSYQWSRASTANGSYTAISGATSSTYLTTAADVGNYLEVAVGATNGNGTIYDTSTASPQIARAGTTLSLTSANQIPVFRTTNNLTANTNSLAGKVSFTIGGKAIPGCKAIQSSAGNSYNAVCPWKPSIHAPSNVVATFTPTDSNYLGTSKTLGPLQIVVLSGNR